MGTEEVLANKLAGSETAIELFFEQCAFDDQSLRLVGTTFGALQGNHVTFALRTLGWLQSNAGAISSGPEPLRALAMDLVRQVTRSEHTEQDWKRLHQTTFWLLSSLSDDLAFEIANDPFWNLFRSSLYEPALTQSMMWFWQQRVHVLDVEASLSLLKLALTPCTKTRSARLAHSVEVEPMFMVQSGCHWHDLTHNYATGQWAILGFLEANRPWETLKILVDTLDCLLYLESSGDIDAPPCSHTAIQRNSIEDTSQTENQWPHFASQLLILVRDLLAQHQGLAEWLSAIDNLAKGRWFCFHRLAMNALAEAEGEQSLALVVEHLPIWIQRFCEPEERARAEYHHELWRLLNLRSYEIASLGPSGQKLIRTVVVTLEAWFNSSQQELETRYGRSAYHENYVGREMRVWLGALEPALRTSGFEALLARLEYYRSDKAQFGEDKESELFSHYMTGGHVREVSLIGAEDFIAIIENSGLDGAVDYLLANPARRMMDEYRDGEIISRNLGPMLKELVLQHPAEVVGLLQHPRIALIDPDYLSDIGYGIDELARSLKSEGTSEVRLDGLLKVIDAALQLRRLQLVARPEELERNQAMHGAYMALWKAAELAKSEAELKRVIALCSYALQPGMFQSKDNEPSTRRADGTNDPLDAFRAISEPAFPLLGLNKIAWRLYEPTFSKDYSATSADVELRQEISEVLQAVFFQASLHPAHNHLGAFLGENIQFLLDYGKRFSTGLEAVVRTEFAKSVTERETSYGSSIRFGYLRGGRFLRSHLGDFLPLYDYCVTEYANAAHPDSYGRHLAMHLFMLFALITDRTEPEAAPLPTKAHIRHIDALLRRVLKQREDVYGDLKRQLIRCPVHHPKRCTKERWSKILLPFYLLVLSEVGQASSLYTTFLGWAGCLPEDLSLTEKLGNGFTARDLFCTALLATQPQVFNPHEVARLVDVLLERTTAQPKELPCAAGLVCATLRLCKRVREADKEALMPWWKLQEVWHLVSRMDSLSPQKKQQLEPLRQEIEELLRKLRISPPASHPVG